MFEGVVEKKNSPACCFQGNTHKLYINLKVVKVEFDKIIFFFVDCFFKAAEAVKAKTTD